MTTPEPTAPAAPAFRPTNLTDAELDDLRAEATRHTSSMVDPYQVARVTAFIADRHEWVQAVLGRPVDGISRSNRDILLLHLVAKKEPHPPDPPRTSASQSGTSEQTTP